MNTLKCCAAAALLFIISWRASAADALSSDQTQFERLELLCRVWGAVRYLHPYLAYKSIDWDAALIDALPHVTEAHTTSAYRAAIEGMLGVLHDPLTHVRTTELPQTSFGQSNSRSSKRESQEPFRWFENGILLIRLENVLSTADSSIIPLRTAIAKADSTIVDLRAQSPSFHPRMLVVLEAIQGLLVDRTVHTPPRRHIVHTGYKPQVGYSTGGYGSAFAMTLADTFAPTPGRHTRVKRVAFITDGSLKLPPFVLATHAAGLALLIANREITDSAALVTRVIPLGDGLEAVIRTEEFADGYVLRSDAVVSRDESDPDSSIKTAQSLLKSKPSKSFKHRTALPVGHWVPDAKYEQMHFPSVEYRMLALFRFWNIIEYFYPSKHLILKEWRPVLQEFIPRFEVARDRGEYELAIAELATHVPDGHTAVSAAAVWRSLGYAAPPVTVDMIEHQLVVTRVISRDIAARVAVGDVVQKIDGEPFEQRMQRMRRLLTASTRAAQDQVLASYVLNGPDHSTVVITIQDRTKHELEIALPRTRAYAARRPSERDGDRVRLLAGNIGYVDLDRLTVPEVDDMFIRLKDTRGIIFDMRGFPHTTAWEIAPRINTKGATFGAMFLGPQVELGNSDERYLYMQPLPTTDKSKYQGKTVMLIDGRTISQGEHTGLFFEAANGTKFIGVASAGADGDVTSFVLPGGVVVQFAGHEVRHADGRPLQRVGLIPDIEAHPSIAGIRAGKDEILDRAIDYLKQDDRREGLGSDKR